MARPLGAINKDKPFRDALRMELAAAGEDHKALRAIARNLILLAQKEDIAALPAIREIGDRSDGKVPQGVVGGDDDDPAIKMIHTIKRVIVEPDTEHTDSESIQAAS